MEKYERIELNSLAISLSLVDGSIILVDGSASIFGCPLRVNIRYRLIDRSITIDACGKARIDVYGSFFVGMPRPICSDLIELDALLTVRRTEASLSSASVSGPVVLIVGDSDTGKSTACVTLANLATAAAVSRSGKKATESSTNSATCVAVVDLDVGQGSITAPGCISAAFVEAPIPVDEGFSHMTPAAFFFGDKVVTTATRKRYLDLCSFIHQSIRAVMSSKHQYRSGGIIVNTMGWVRDLGYELLQQLVSIFQATHVVVTSGSNLDVFDRLKSDFAFAQDTVSFYRLPTPLPTSWKDTGGGNGPQFVGRSGLDRLRLRNAQIHSYFFGTFRNPLSPIRVVVFLKDVVLVNAVTLEELSVKQLRPLMLAAVSTAPHRELCASSNVAGFVIITDIGKTTLSILSPAPGKLPRPFLLVSPTITAVPEDIPPFGAQQQQV